jgi:peptide/nickel transport system substrate-binding protein
MQRYRHIIMIAIVTAALAGQVTAQDKPRYGGELIFAVPSEPPSYDGHREETFGVIHPMAPHYNTLLRTDPNDKTGTKLVGDLAESWTMAKDGRTYTFKLRKGVKFHDGSEMTSADVKASYDKIVFPPQGVASDRQGQYVFVEAVQAPDPYTVVFRLKWPAASFLASVGSPWNWIYRADILAKDVRWYEKNVMGTGPFTFVEHVRGSHWVGKKNPNYWDKGKPYLDSYRAVFIRDSAAQVAAVRGERAHIQFRGFSPSERDSLTQALGPKITVQESLGLRPDGRHEPREEALRRQAGPPRTLAGTRSLPGLAGAVEDRRRQGGGGRPGAGNTLRHAAGRAGEARRVRPRHRQVAGRGQAAPQGGGRSRRLRVHVQEPRHPHAL